MFLLLIMRKHTPFLSMIHKWKSGYHKRQRQIPLHSSHNILGEAHIFSREKITMSHFVILAVLGGVLFCYTIIETYTPCQRIEQHETHRHICIVQCVHAGRFDKQPLLISRRDF